MDDYVTRSDGSSIGGKYNNIPQRNVIMELPLFPLNVVLFPGMVLPLHIFEPRYREMVERCVDEGLPFGVILIKEGHEVAGPSTPYAVGTAARIVRVEQADNGQMNITAVGTKRFRVLELDHSRSYLSAKVSQFPAVNGGTRLATELVQKVRPKIIEYVELLGKASQTHLNLDRLPEDPTTLAFLVAISLQISNEDKQGLLEIPGIPQMLDRERYLLSWETKLLEYMIETQGGLQAMSSGSSGYIFPN